VATKDRIQFKSAWVGKNSPSSTFRFLNGDNLFQSKFKGFATESMELE